MSVPRRLYVPNARSVENRETTVFVGPGSRWATPFLNQYLAPSSHEIEKFRDWITKGPESVFWLDDGVSDDWARWLEMIRLLPTLRGKDLADTTAIHESSHADVLLELANGAVLPRLTVSWDPAS
jgi:hypothetical protein